MFDFVGGYRKNFTAMSLFVMLSCLASFVSQAKEKPLQIAAIAEGVYQHTSFSYVEGFGNVASNGLIVVQSKHAYLVDTPWSEADTRTLFDWVEQQGWQLVASVSTHWHDDRTAGIAFLNQQNVPTYTSALTHELLLENGKPTATQIFSEDNFALAPGLVQVFYPGPGHAQDNLVVWLPQVGILFGGCLIRAENSTSLGYTGDASIQDWAQSVKNAKAAFPHVEAVLPGHGELSSAALLDHTINLVETHLAQTNRAK